MSCPHNGISHAEDGHLEPSEDFDFSKIDADLGWVERGNPDIAIRDEVIEQASEGLALFLGWVWVTPDGKTRNHNSATLRFLAASATLRPQLFKNRSFNQIAARVGCTRAAISKLSVEFSDNFKLHFRVQKRSEARQVYRRTNRPKTTSAPE